MAVTVIRQVGRPSRIENSLAAMLTEVGNNLITILQQADRVATGRAQEIQVVISKPNSAQLITADYIVYALFGRDPGLPPPVADILEWIIAKPVSPRGNQTLRQAAFGIAQSIGQKGTPAAVSQQVIAALIDQALNNQLSNVADVIAKDMADEWVKKINGVSSNLKNVLRK